MLTGLALGWALAGGGASAQNSPSHPDWSGLYSNPSLAAFQGRKVDLHGFASANADLDPVVMGHLQPWAAALMEATDTEADDTGAVCLSSGIFRHPSTVAGFQFIFLPDKILMVSTDVQQVGTRRIYLTDKHPANLPYTWNGHSIGHWEGDTLVVDTVGFNDKSWLMSGRDPHTEELHVVERIRAVADGELIEVATTVEDRKALTTPYGFTRYYNRTNQDFPQEICNGTPGEQQRWNGIRKDAIQRQLQRKVQSTVAQQP